jgi:hypothetical protein
MLTILECIVNAFVWNVGDHIEQVGHLGDGFQSLLKLTRKTDKNTCSTKKTGETSIYFFPSI